MASSSSSKGSLLPIDILESIFCRVPAESLIRCKLVCKRWFNLLKDKRFVYNHLHLVQQHFIHLSGTLQIINPETNSSFSLPFPDEFRVSDSNIIVMHCDGLLLSITDKESPKIAVWNPFFNQVRWILKPNGVFKSHQLYDFGYDNISRDNYKMLWFGRENFTNPTCEIYEFKTDSWKTLDAPLDWALYHSVNGVSVKGNMYWIVDSKRIPSTKCIECFDFSTETFKSITPFTYSLSPSSYYSKQAPTHCVASLQENNCVALSAYGEEKLSLIHQQPGNIEVWITNNVEDGVVSWIKLFALSSPDLPVHMDDYSPFARYFIDKNNMINFMSYDCTILLTDGDFESNISSKIHIIGKDGFQTKEIRSHSRTGISNSLYRPSLVQVPQKEDMRKK